MCLFAYVDESGQPDQLDRGPYVLVSVVIDEGDVDYVSSQISGFINALPSRYGVGGVVEFHTIDVVTGSNEWRGVSEDVRARVFNDFAELISGLNFLLNIVVVRAAGNVRVNKPDRVRRYAIMNLIERLFMAKSLYPNQSRVVMVIDSLGGVLNDRIRNDIEYAIKNSRARPTYKLLKAFESSVEEPPLQLADYVAYVVRRVFKGQLQHGAFSFGRAFQLFEGRIRRCPNGNTYHGCGLKVWEIR